MVGRSQPRLDIPDKVTGRFTYMQDFHVEGMVHGSVVRPPAIGATLLSVDVDSVSHVPGLIKVVRRQNFLAVVAKTEWGAISAARQLKARWSDWQGLPDEDKLWDYVRATKIVKDDVTSNRGKVEAALSTADRRLSSTYDFAIHTHGSIGPSCAVASFEGGKLTCWSASQATHNLRQQLALMFTMPDTDVRVIYIDGSGCYGRNGHEDAAADAALLARRLVARCGCSGCEPTNTDGIRRGRRRSSTCRRLWTQAATSAPGIRSSMDRKAWPARLSSWRPNSPACRMRSP